MLPPYKSPLSFPIAEDLSTRGLNLPSGSKLLESQIQEISESLTETLEKADN